MTDPDAETPLTRTAASDAVQASGWRYLLGALVVSIAVRSLAQASEVAVAAVAACGQDADDHLRLDLRAERVELSVQTRRLGAVTARDTRLARRITDGLGLVDPAGQLPTIWFQHMDTPRPQRNRIHFDLAVAHDEAETRIRAALTAGGHLVSAKYARSFSIVADAEGNEVCICTWQDRDAPPA